MKHPARGRSNAGRGDMARRRQAISASMRIAETRGSTRRRENPLNTPRPGRSLPGHVRRRGRGRTSKVSQRSSVACGQRHAQAGHASDRRRADRAQDSLSVCRRKDRVLACDARAGQRNVPRASNHSGSEGQSDVGTVDAGQVQVRAQGSAREATAIVHGTTIKPPPGANKRCGEPCGRSRAENDPCGQRNARCPCG